MKFNIKVKKWKKNVGFFDKFLVFVQDGQKAKKCFVDNDTWQKNFFEKGVLLTICTLI